MATPEGAKSEKFSDILCWDVSRRHVWSDSYRPKFVVAMLSFSPSVVGPEPRKSFKVSGGERAEAISTSETFPVTVISYSLAASALDPDGSGVFFADTDPDFKYPDPDPSVFFVKFKFFNKLKGSKRCSLIRLPHCTVLSGSQESALRTVRNNPPPPTPSVTIALRQK